MIELNGETAELRITIEITRAATGEKEQVELIGKVISVEENTNQDEE